jgi:hypothetical protein
MAFELGEKNWKLALALGVIQYGDRVAVRDTNDFPFHDPLGGLSGPDSRG